MNQVSISDTVSEDGISQALVPLTPDEFKKVLSQNATVISRFKTKTADEYVVDGGHGSAISLTICQTDDDDTIQTEYDLEDFVRDDDPDPNPTVNTLVITTEPEEVLTDFLNTL